MELKKIKLNRLANRNLAEREMKALQGGNCCVCTCAYMHQGGASTHDNKSANYRGNYTSKKLNPYNECDFEIQCD